MAAKTRAGDDPLYVEDVEIEPISEELLRRLAGVEQLFGSGGEKCCSNDHCSNKRPLAVATSPAG